MYEVKQGRESAFMSAIFGLAFAGCGLAMLIGTRPPVFIAVFLSMFILIGVSTAGFSLGNALAKNRPDEFDVTTDREEPDPLNEKFGKH